MDVLGFHLGLTPSGRFGLQTLIEHHSLGGETIRSIDGLCCWGHASTILEETPGAGPYVLMLIGMDSSGL